MCSMHQTFPPSPLKDYYYYYLLCQVSMRTKIETKYYNYVIRREL